MVGIGPGVVSGVIDKMPVYVAGVLFASVQRDMDAARGALCAVLGDEDIAAIGEAERAGIVGLGVQRLVEARRRSAQLSAVGRVQRAVNVLQQDSGLIVTALVDERNLVVVAGVE